MSEPDISTLARRLAEQNNVDWRGLGGSGPDGKVVERDVLDYLARVMAGEEATNPTPEPLPSGMDMWPDQDLDNFRSGVNAGAAEAGGSLGDLRDELGRSVRPDEPISAPTSAESPADDGFGAVESVQFGSAQTLDNNDLAGAARDADMVGVDEDIFLFGDDDGDTAGSDAVDEVALSDGADSGTSAPPADLDAADSFTDAAAAASSLAANDDLDDLLVAGEELGEDEETSEGVPGTAYSTGFGSDVAPESADASMSGTAASDFGELKPAGFEAPDDSLGLGEDLDADLDAGLDGGNPAAAGQAGGQSDDAWGSNISLGDDNGAFGGSAAGGADSDTSDLWGEPEKESTGGGDLWSAEAAEATVAGDSGPGDESPWSSATAASAPSDMDRAADPWGAGLSSEETPADAEQAADATIGDGDDVDNAAESVANDELNVGAAAAVDLPLARSASILRRHIDLSALASSQVSVGNELGFDEPLGVAPFLLRAVAKAAGALDVPPAHVALAVLGDGLRLRRVGDAAERSFASLVGELAAEVVEEDEPRLVAADLSVLDLDEALLDLDVPVVTLGRILYDNQRGAYRSTLTLTGAVHPDAGAKLLARVAELLDAPVRLVL